VLRTAFRVVGCPVAVGGSSDCLALLGRLLAPFAARSATLAPVAHVGRRSDGLYVLETPGHCSWGDFLTVIGECEWWLVGRCLAARDDLLQLHGGAAADRRGAVLLPGVSGSGKTTLTLALLARGLLPLADDAILIDGAQGVVLPFARSFHVDGGTLSVVERLGITRHLLLPDDLAPGYCRPRRWAPPSAPRLIVQPTYRPGQPLQLERLRPAQTWMVLAGARLASGGAPDHFATVARLTEELAAYRLWYPDAAAAAAAIDALLAEEGAARG